MRNAIVAVQHGKDQNELRPVPSINPLNPLILLIFFFFLLSTPVLTSPLSKTVTPTSFYCHLSVARQCFKSVPFHCSCLSHCLFVTVCLSHSLIRRGVTPPSKVHRFSQENSWGKTKRWRTKAAKQEKDITFLFSVCFQPRDRSQPWSWSNPIRRLIATGCGLRFVRFWRML